MLLCVWCSVCFLSACACVRACVYADTSPPAHIITPPWPHSLLPCRPRRRGGACSVGGPYRRQGGADGAVQPAVQGHPGPGGAGAWRVTLLASWAERAMLVLQAAWRPRGLTAGLLRRCPPTHPLSLQSDDCSAGYLTTHVARTETPSNPQHCHETETCAPHTFSKQPQEITTRDETGAPCSRGMRTTPFGQYVADGPPTCMSGAPSLAGGQLFQLCRAGLPGPETRAFGSVGRSGRGLTACWSAQGGCVPPRSSARLPPEPSSPACCAFLQPCHLQTRASTGLCRHRGRWCATLPTSSTAARLALATSSR